MKRGYSFKNSVAFIFLVVSCCCFLVLIISMQKVPDSAPGINGAMPFYNHVNILKVSDQNDNPLGTFGNMMLQMLPEDLVFTVFVPSETAFHRDLRLSANDSLVGEKMDDVYAVVSRILGFSAVPRMLDSASVTEEGREVSYDALCGFRLFICKDAEGRLVVNGVKSERVDIRRGKLVVHIMDGAIMDAEFQQSVQPDFDEDND